MNELIKNLAESLNQQPFVFLTVLIATISMMLVLPKFLKILIKDKANRIGSKDTLFKMIDSNLSNSLIQDKEDIILLLNSVNREYYKDFSLASVIEDYIAYRSDKDDGGILKNNYELLKSIIKIENEEKPFSNIPDQERRLLRAIDDSVKHNDIDSISYHLQELNSVISTRTKIYQRTNAINRWSIPAAIIGILLTVIFGIMSLTPS